MCLLNLIVPIVAEKCKKQLSMINLTIESCINPYTYYNHTILLFHPPQRQDQYIDAYVMCLCHRIVSTQVFCMHNACGRLLDKEYINTVRLVQFFFKGSDLNGSNKCNAAYRYNSADCL